jgi:hypothetical protein
MNSSGVRAAEASQPSSETAPPAFSSAVVLLEGHFESSREALQLGE